MWREREERNSTYFSACNIPMYMHIHFFILISVTHLLLETVSQHYGDMYYEDVRIETDLSFVDDAGAKPNIYRSALY